MFKHKKHLFFDLDHTLWDFEANSFDCLSDIYQEFNIASSGFSVVQFHSAFSEINKSLWTQLERNTIEQENIRKYRFQLTLKKLDSEISTTESENMNAHFLAALPTRTKLITDCKEVLDVLKSSYSLHILSNGYAPIQLKKIQNGGIADFFNKVVTNDLANARKPSKDIFNYSLKETGSTIQEALMIGDSYEADILGAKKAGWDTIHFTEKDDPTENLSTVKIKHLKQLLHYL